MALPINCFQLSLPCPVNDPSICLSCLSSTGQVQSLDIPVELNFPVAIIESFHVYCLRKFKYRYGMCKTPINESTQQSSSAIYIATNLFPDIKSPLC